MNPKQRKQLKKMVKQHQQTKPASYIEQMMNYRELFDDFSNIKYLINNVLESDRLLKNGLLPQPLPMLILPDDTQDQIFNYLNTVYPPGDPKGDIIWNRYSEALPKLDKLLRGFRDYLEDTYGVWSYVNAPFVKDLATFINHAPVLEVMAGNGYISKGLRNLDSSAQIFTTDNKAWVDQNETGKHPVTQIENLDALAAWDKYQEQIKYVIMSWAPDKQSTDWQLLQKIRASKRDVTLITIGEQNGATNSKDFWQNAKMIDQDHADKLSKHLKSFDLIDEKVFLVK